MGILIQGWPYDDLLSLRYVKEALDPFFLIIISWKMESVASLDTAPDTCFGETSWRFTAEISASPHFLDDFFSHACASMTASVLQYLKAEALSVTWGICREMTVESSC